MAKVLVIKDWKSVADNIWIVFQGTGVSKDVADVLVNRLKTKLIKESLIGEGELVAEFKGLIHKEHLERVKKGEVDCVHAYTKPAYVAEKYDTIHVLLLKPAQQEKERGK